MKISHEEKKISSLLGKAFNREEIPPKEDTKAKDEKALRETLKTACFIKYGLEPPDLSPLFSQKLKKNLIAEASRQYAKKGLLPRFGLREFSFNFGLSFRAMSFTSAVILCALFTLFIMKGNEKSNRLSSYHQLYQEVTKENDIGNLYRKNSLHYLETIYELEEHQEINSFWSSMMRQVESQTLEYQDFPPDIQLNGLPLPEEPAGNHNIISLNPNIMKTPKSFKDMLV